MRRALNFLAGKGNPWNDWGVDMTLDKSQQVRTQSGGQLGDHCPRAQPSSNALGSLLWPINHATRASCHCPFYLVILLMLPTWLFVLNIFHPSQAFFIQTSTGSFLFWENRGHQTQISSSLPKKISLLLIFFLVSNREMLFGPLNPQPKVAVLLESAGHLQRSNGFWGLLRTARVFRRERFLWMICLLANISEFCLVFSLEKK